MIGVGALMVSRLETPAFRPVRVAPERARMLLLLAVALAALLLARPWLTLVLLDLAYLLVLARAGWRAWRPARES
jgi:CDP-diacylglycerol--serine O-phosphatidyltransferase